MSLAAAAVTRAGTWGEDLLVDTEHLLVSRECGIGYYHYYIVIVCTITNYF